MSLKYALLALFIVAACGGSGSKYDYSKCGEPAAIAVTNEDVLDGDGLALPKGVETDIGLKVTDAEGDLCDPSGLELSFDGAAWVEIVDQGEDVVLVTTQDAIDFGAEPSATMSASLGDLHASWTLSGVIALGGTWDVTITETNRFPNGYPFAGVVFTQLGRRMRWEDCTISLVCERDAVIVGRDFTIEAPDIGLAVSAPIADDRRSFSGPWSAMDGDYAGSFTAERAD